MVSKVIAPSTASKSFSCPHCGAHASQTWWTLIMTPIEGDGLPFVPDKNFMMQVANPPVSKAEAESRARMLEYVNRISKGEVFKTEVQYAGSETELVNVHVSECYSCGKFAIWHHDVIIYPPQRYEVEPNADLPDNVRKDFDEARAILNLSPRGASALLRLCVQKLCIHLGKPGKNIDADIASLVVDGLDVRVQQALDIVRVIGNESVHPGQMDLADDRDTAATLFGLVNRIAFDTITHPKELAALYGKLPASKREAIAKRDAPKKS